MAFLCQGAVAAGSTAHLGRAVGQVAPRLRRTALGYAEGIVLVQDGQEARAAPAEAGLETVAEDVADAVLLDLRVSVMHYAHPVAAGAVQRHEQAVEE